MNMSETPPPSIPPADKPAVPDAASPTSSPAAPTTPILAAPVARAGNGFGLAALILGIVALLGAAFPVINIFSAILAVVGLILGIVGLTRKGASKGTSIAGTIISGVAIVIVIVSSIILALGLALLEGAADDPVPAETTAEPTAEPAPDDGPNPVPEGEVGSFTNPVPLGVAVTFTVEDVDVWKVTVQSSTLNANDVVAAADPSNPTTNDGSQFALVDARFEHVGPGTATPSEDLAIVYATAPGDYYLESDVEAVAPAPSWRDIVGIEQASIAGNAIVVIPTNAAGVWGISPLGTDLIFFFATQ